MKRFSFCNVLTTTIKIWDILMISRNKIIFFYRSNFFIKLNFSIEYVGRMPKVCQIPFKLSILIDFTLSDWHMYFSISFPRLYYTLHAYYACITWCTLVLLKNFLHNMYYVPFILYTYLQIHIDLNKGTEGLTKLGISI